MSSVSLNSSHQDSPVPVALLPLIVFQKRDPLSNSASSWCLRLSMSEKIRLSPTPFAVTTASLRRTPLCGDRYKDRFEYRTVRRAHRGQMDQSVIRMALTSASMAVHSTASTTSCRSIIRPVSVTTDTGNSFVLRPPAGTLFIQQVVNPFRSGTIEEHILNHPLFDSRNRGIDFSCSSASGVFAFQTLGGWRGRRHAFMTPRPRLVSCTETPSAPAGPAGRGRSETARYCSCYCRP
jgi:hypothetical protein